MKSSLLEASTGRGKCSRQRDMKGVPPWPLTENLDTSRLFSLCVWGHLLISRGQQWGIAFILVQLLSGPPACLTFHRAQFCFLQWIQTDSFWNLVELLYVCEDMDWRGQLLGESLMAFSSWFLQSRALSSQWPTKLDQGFCHLEGRLDFTDLANRQSFLKWEYDS